MDWSNQKIVLAVGATVALIAGVVLAVLFMGRDHRPAAAPPAAQGGLQVSVNNTVPLDPQKQLQCYVDGAPVGELSLADCARKNGVATGALDVGLDDQGNLAAAPTASLAPPPALPPAAAATAPVAVPPSLATAPADQRTTSPTQAEPAQQPVQAHGPTAVCLRFTGSEWRQVSDSLSLNGCVQALFAGRCVHPGEADYGRFGEVTLRLVPGRVEQSNDNNRFHTLVEQRGGCEIPSVH